MLSIFHSFPAMNEMSETSQLTFKNNIVVANRRQKKYRLKFKVIQVQTESAYVFNCEHNM